MLETDKLDSHEQDQAEIAEAQRRIIQLLAKAVVERLEIEGKTAKPTGHLPHEVT